MRKILIEPSPKMSIFDFPNSVGKHHNGKTLDKNHSRHVAKLARKERQKQNKIRKK